MTNSDKKSISLRDLGFVQTPPITKLIPNCKSIAEIYSEMSPEELEKARQAQQDRYKLLYGHYIKDEDEL